MSNRTRKFNVGNVSSQQGFYVTNTTGTNAVIQADTNKNVDISAGTTGAAMINFFRDSIKTGPNNANGYIRLDNTTATAIQTASLTFAGPSNTIWGRILGTPIGVNISSNYNNTSSVFNGLVISGVNQWYGLAGNSNNTLGVYYISDPLTGVATTVATFSSTGGSGNLTITTNNRSATIGSYSFPNAATSGKYPSPGLCIESNDNFGTNPYRLYMGVFNTNSNAGGGLSGSYIQATSGGSGTQGDQAAGPLYINSKGGDVLIGNVATFSSTGLNVNGVITAPFIVANHDISKGQIKLGASASTTTSGNLEFLGPAPSYTTYGSIYGTSSGLSVNAYIGFGGIQPSYPIHIASGWGNNGTLGGVIFTLYNSITAELRQTNVLPAIGIYCGSNLFCSALFYGSDQRIKTNIKSADTSVLLTTLNAVQLRNYNYIDTIEYGTQTELGFIAQEVKDTYPNAVTILKQNRIPSIMKSSTNIQLTSDRMNVVISVAIPSTSELTIGGNVELLIEDKSSALITCVVSFTESQLVVPIWENFDETKKIYVYGALIDNFGGVDETQFISLCMGGVQELSKRNDVLTAQVSALQLQVNTLMQQMATLLAKN